MLVQCKPIWNLKSMRMRSCDPCAKYFFLIWHVGSQTKYDHSSVSFCKVNRLFWSFLIKSTFCVEFWVSAPLKSVIIYCWGKRQCRGLPGSTKSLICLKMLFGYYEESLTGVQCITGVNVMQESTYNNQFQNIIHTSKCLSKP